MAAPIAILYVHSSAHQYGSDGGLLRMVAGLDRRRFTPFVVVPEAGPLVTELRELGVETYIHPLTILHRTLNPVYWGGQAFNLPRTVGWLAGLIRRKQIRLVHTNTSHVIDGALAARRAGVAHIWHLRELHTGRSRVGRVLSRLIARTSDMVLAMSDASAAAFFPAAPPGLPIHTVYDGIDVGRFCPQNDGSSVRRELGLAPDTPLVGMAGRIAHWKGHALFLQAAAQIVTQQPDVRFLVVGDAVTAGDARLKEELLAQRRLLGLEERVIFAGLRDDMPAVMAALDLFVLPSTQPEPWGFVTLEAMATGKPVIATRQGGPLEMVVDGETGYLVSPHDPAELAHKALALLAAPDKARAMGAAGRLRCVERFSVKQSCMAIMGYYETVLGDATARR
jgi:glycosyltransferase involved in cell wall biosynthesis